MCIHVTWTTIHSLRRGWRRSPSPLRVMVRTESLSVPAMAVHVRRSPAIESPLVLLLLLVVQLLLLILLLLLLQLLLKSGR